MTITPPPLAFDWDRHALAQRLQSIAPGCTVEVVTQTGSTNSDLLDRQRLGSTRVGSAAPVLRVAEQQTAGRGRLGRQWWSRPGQSLTFSIGLALHPADWSGLSLAVGLAVAEALGTQIDETPGQERIGLKWPNDLWLRGEDRKLGGILIEAQMLRQAPDRAPLPPGGSQARWAVVGVGINLLARPTDEHDDGGNFRTGYASLGEFCNEPTPPAVLHSVAPALLGELLRFEREGLTPRLSAYARRDVLAGRQVSAGELVGLCRGIAPGGELCLRDDAGIEHRISSGEVSVRPC